MTLRFRNLDVSPDDPVADWGVEGLLTAIDRGAIADWRRIVRALDHDETGRLAEQLEQALGLAEDRGAAAALRRALAAHRSGAPGEIARRVRRALRRSGLTAAELAELVGTSASRLSTYRTGRVTPSAALLHRIERLAARRTL